MIFLLYTSAILQVQSLTGSSIPFSHVAKHQRHSALGKVVPTESVKFRGPGLKALKNVIIPPLPPPPPVEHKRARATSHMPKTTTLACMKQP